MAESTGPILALGAITMANRSVFNSQPWDWRIPIATGLLVALGAGAEAVFPPDLVRGVAIIALATVVLTRVDPKVPSPTESFTAWWQRS